MDEVQIVTQTLHATVQRAAKQAQNYEIEIVNLTAEIARLQAEVERKNTEIAGLKDQINGLLNVDQVEVS